MTVCRTAAAARDDVVTSKFATVSFHTAGPDNWAEAGGGKYETPATKTRTRRKPRAGNRKVPAHSLNIEI